MKTVEMKSEARGSTLQSSPSYFQRILVAVDGSDNSLRASKMAVDLAKDYKSELIFLTVVPMPTHAFSLAAPNITPQPGAFEEEREYTMKVAGTVLDRASRIAQDSGLTVRSEIQETVDSVVEDITEYARGEKADLIVIGTRGLSGFKKLIIGSVSGGVISHAHCPVLVVR